MAFCKDCRADVKDLFQVVRHGWLTRVKEICDRGDVDLELKDEEGRTALMYAVDELHFNIVQEL
jgi:ankyrin repeat protein